MIPLIAIRVCFHHLGAHTSERAGGNCPQERITHTAEEITACIQQITGAAPDDVANTGRRPG